MFKHENLRISLCMTPSGIGWIVAIIVGAIIVLVLLVVFVKCVFKGYEAFQS